MHTIYVIEYNDDQYPYVYQVCIADEDLSSTDNLVRWLNGTLVDYVYLEDYTSQYTSEKDENTDESKFATVSNGLLIDFHDMIYRPDVYHNDIVYIYGEGCTYIFNRKLHKVPYYKEL